MTDILDEGLAAFDRQLGIEPGTEDTATDEATEAADTAGTPEDQDTSGERPRDPETGKFVAKETEQPPAKTGQDEKFESYLSRFGADPGTFDDLAPELQKAIRAGFEADSMTGRQGQELGELKKTLEQIQAQTAPQPTQPPAYEAEAVMDHFAANPTQILPAIQQAYATDDRTLVYLGIRALEDVDPVLAEGLRIEIAKRDALAEMSPHIARSEQQDFNTTFTSAWNQVKADHPDIDQFADQILQAAQADPDALMGLQEGTPESAKRVLTNLYKIAAFDAARSDGSTLATAAAQAAAEQAAAADTAKREGFVASGTQRVEPEPISPGEKWLEDLGFDKHAAKYYENT